MGLGLFRLRGSRNEENGRSPTSMLKFALDAFELEPSQADQIAIRRLFSAGERPTSKGEVEFCLWQRKFVDRGHDPPQLFSCSFGNQHLCIAQFRTFAPALGCPKKMQGLQGPVKLEATHPQSGFAEDGKYLKILVADLVGADEDGPRFRICMDYDPASLEKHLPEQADRLVTFSVPSRTASTQEQSLAYLMTVFEDTIFTASGYSSCNVRQQAGPPQLDMSNATATPKLRMLEYLCLLINSDAGHGLAEIAWLARSFELGNAGNPPDGTCGSSIYSFAAWQKSDEKILGMYSCVTADAPRKCNNTEEPPPKPEHFTGFVKVTRMDNIVNIVEELRKGNFEEVIGSSQSRCCRDWPRSRRANLHPE